jgi:hypothetical protein
MSEIDWPTVEAVGILVLVIVGFIVWRKWIRPHV